MVSSNVSEAPAALPDNPGSQFWQWLVTGCQHGEIAVNQAENSVHLTGGYLFLPSPWIFRQYLTTTGGELQEKDAIQKAFERLRYHRRNSGKMVTCHLYQTAMNLSWLLYELLDYFRTDLKAPRWLRTAEGTRFLDERTA
ncbi:conjugal transfer nickase/helicase domain-containing protein [Morganella morganii]